MLFATFAIIIKIQLIHAQDDFPRRLMITASSGSQTDWIPVGMCVSVFYGPLMFIVSLSTRETSESLSRHVCTGVLILPDVVLTAAHCLVGYEIRELNVLVGNSSTPATIASTVNPAFVFNGFTGHNDISLVFLENCVSEISRFPLLDAGIEESVCKPVEGLGFGRSEQIPPSIYVPDGKLRSVTSNQHIHSHEVCKSAFVNHLIKTEFSDTPINPTMMTLIETSVSNTIGCYGGDLAAFEAGYPCDGDSGGPVIAKDTKTVIGITSFGAEICGTTPNYYTRVSEYAHWIRSQLTRRKRNKCPHDPASLDSIFNHELPGPPSRNLAPTGTTLELSEVTDLLTKYANSSCKPQFDQLNTYLGTSRPVTRGVREKCASLISCLDSGSEANSAKMANTFLHAFPSGIAETTLLTYAQRKSVSRLLLCTSEYEGFYRSFERDTQINESYMNVAPAGSECASVTI